MRSRRVRSGTMWAGAGLSALAHAGLVWLALLAPPWLRPHPERPVPTIAVALVTPADFEAAAAAPARPAPEPVAARPVAAPPVTPARPEGEPAEPALPSLAPAFDPAAPLGLAAASPARDLPAHRPRPRPGAPRAAVPSSAAAVEALGAFEAAVQRAVSAAQAGPPNVAERGGTVRLALVVTRDGRLLAARLVASSGSERLDRAALDTARAARLPQMPEAMPNARATVEIELVFAGGD